MIWIYHHKKNPRKQMKTNELTIIITKNKHHYKRITQTNQTRETKT